MGPAAVVPAAASPEHPAARRGEWPFCRLGVVDDWRLAKRLGSAVGGGSTATGTGLPSDSTSHPLDTNYEIDVTCPQPKQSPALGAHSDEKSATSVRSAVRRCSVLVRTARPAAAKPIREHMNATCHRKNLVTSTIGAAVATAPAVLVFGVAPGCADTPGQFQSPSGNIACGIGIASQGPMTGKSSAGCEIREHSWTAANCPGGGGLQDSFVLNQGDPARVVCDANKDPQTKQIIPGRGTRFVPGLPTLDAGQTQSAGSITCDSEPSGIKCTDSSSGHFFQVSRDSYQVG